MKKLMMAVAIVCAAAFAQASQFKWQIEGVYDGYQIDKTYGGNVEAWYGQPPAPVSGATVYLIDAVSRSAADLVSDWQGGSSLSSLATSYGVAITAGANSGTTGADGALAAFTALTSTKVDFTAYAAMEKDGYLYVSEVTAFNHNDIVPPEITVTSGDASGVFNGTGYAGAGWYAAVPEPTSGLLLLLGVAGLALKRRRA